MVYLSIGKLDYTECLRVLQSVEAAEIRFDLNSYSPAEIKELCAANGNLIATCRPGALTDFQRLEILKTAIQSGAALADIELEAEPDYRRELAEIIRKHSCLIIISYHNYELTPSVEELEQIMSDCFAAGADIAKIACYAHNVADTERVMALYASGQPVTAFAMGEAGRNSRIIAAVWGAEISYAALSEDSATADGQFTYTELTEIVRRMVEGETV